MVFNNEINFSSSIEKLKYNTEVDLPIKFSSGFNPRVQLAFALPLAVGVTSECEYFDLELIGKILDEKNENKIDNLDNKVNVAKNKRLFMMEILKIKYKKGITDNDFIDSEMLFNEVMKKNIKMNDWANFILEQINNKEKCLTIKVKKK